MKEQMSFSRLPMPVSSQCMPEPQEQPLSAREESPLMASVLEVLSCDHQVHELYSDTRDEESFASADPSCMTDTFLSFSTAACPSNTQVTVNTALLSRVEVLESENRHLKEKL